MLETDWNKSNGDSSSNNDSCDSDDDNIYVYRDDDGNGWVEINGEIRPIDDVLSPDIDLNYGGDDNNRAPLDDSMIEAELDAEAGDQTNLEVNGRTDVLKPAVANLAINQQNNEAAQPETIDSLLDGVRALRKSLADNQPLEDTKVFRSLRRLQLTNANNTINDLIARMERVKPQLPKQLDDYGKVIDRASDGGYEPAPPTGDLAKYIEAHDLAVDIYLELQKYIGYSGGDADEQDQQ